TLGAPAIVACVVLKLEKKLHRGLERQLFTQPAAHRVVERLASPRVATAGVGPYAGPKAFLHAALLEEDVARRGKQEDRECPVEEALAIVTALLGGETDFLVGIVHQDQSFILKRNRRGNAHCGCDCRMTSVGFADRPARR